MIKGLLNILMFITSMYLAYKISKSNINSDNYWYFNNLLYK